MNRLSALAFTSFLLAAGCVSAGPSRVPNDAEWNRIAADSSKVDTLRRTAPKPGATAGRKEQIELLLQNEKTLEPIYLPFMAELKEYYERTADPRAARMLAAEKVRLGDQYMDVLSRYDRAIAMYQSALAIDPQNADARQRIANAEQKRFVSMDAFAAVRQGMKESEVRALVGVPREDWIKQVVQKGRVYAVWIYPKEDGGASAVYFDNGVVYHTNWNAAPAPEKDKPAAR